MQLVGPCASWTEYEPVFIRTLRELHATGHRTAIFGDIDLEPHREWEERVCAAAGVQPYLPLWQRNRRELADESLALGFRAVVVCTDSRYLGDEFCGREFDARFLADLPANVDACVSGTGEGAGHRQRGVCRSGKLGRSALLFCGPYRRLSGGERLGHRTRSLEFDDVGRDGGRVLMMHHVPHACDGDHSQIAKL
jgi:hypothetical protein